MIRIRAELCPQNHRCPSLRVCPTGAIVQRGYGAPEIDESKCTHCCRCVRTCPVFEGVGECAGRGRR